MTNKSKKPDGYITQRMLGEDYEIPYYFISKNKKVERATWDNSIEGYPSTTPGMAIAITLGSMLIAFVFIELIFGADDFIYYVANLIA